MPLRIESYALIGDCHSGALVGKDGSIDWLCLPRFDSAACFAALLGTPEHGRWLIAPKGEYHVKRQYREGTLILETRFETSDGSATLIDFMPPRTTHIGLIRMVVGRRGRVPMSTELILRPDYGSLIPWVRRSGEGITAIAGPDAFCICSDVQLEGKDFKTVGDFEVAAGKTITFSMTWFPSHAPSPHCRKERDALATAEAWWRDWSGRCQYKGKWSAPVLRSLITLKALTYAPTGGIAAALTSSLPEQLGGPRNWDYRCCWPRDATFTLFALIEAGYIDEAQAFRAWLLRTVAGSPSQLQSVYGLAGEHRLLEFEVPWLPGYENSAPVRVGNLAFTLPAGVLAHGPHQLGGDALAGAGRRESQRRLGTVVVHPINSRHASRRTGRASYLTCSHTGPKPQRGRASSSASLALRVSMVEINHAKSHDTAYHLFPPLC